MGLKTEGLSTTYSVLTPSDTAEHNFKALYVGGTGHVNLERFDGKTCLVSAVPAGTTLPLSGKRVRATSTTATLIVGIY